MAVAEEAEKSDDDTSDKARTFRGRLWTLEKEPARFQLLNTVEYNQLTVKNGWIKSKAVGIKMIELDDKILFFYHENDTTQMGQICKSDQGGDDRLRDLLRNNFLSFTTTELICNGVYRMLVDAELIEVNGERILMTLYKTSGQSIPGKRVAIVCVN